MTQPLFDSMTGQRLDGQASPADSTVADPSATPSSAVFVASTDAPSAAPDAAVSANAGQAIAPEVPEELKVDPAAPADAVSDFVTVGTDADKNVQELLTDIHRMVKDVHSFVQAAAAQVPAVIAAVEASPLSAMLGGLFRK